MVLSEVAQSATNPSRPAALRPAVVIRAGKGVVCRVAVEQAARLLYGVGSGVLDGMRVSQCLLAPGLLGRYR